MKKLINLPRNKWTATPVDVHSYAHCDGQAGGAQVVDLPRKTCCPLNENSGGLSEGTLPGKA